MIRNERFPQKIRKEVRERQKNMCAYCGTLCDGKHDRPTLEVHHVKPIAHGGAGVIENAIGLCPDDHVYFDQKALEENKYFPEVVMEEGKEYLLSLYPHLGI